MRHQKICRASFAMPATEDSYAYLEATLTNVNGDVPLHERFRALFTLKNLADDRSVHIIAKAFVDDSALLKHELAYVLGQTKNKNAIPTLRKVLATLDEEPMVRHEAAEALGAIGDPSCLDILNMYLNDPNETVRQTCELAIAKINFETIQTEERIPSSIYTSIDPAPPSTKTESTKELKAQLLNTKLPLFERYRAMFALRNVGDTEAVLALAEGLEDDSGRLKCRGLGNGERNWAT
ncbi:armadillo-type protein [Jimgerdemannia flammicorona]|uniref:Armadillo-type protein n=1 Tax=Jimgerdemannia flammicorona TaxID=994334 RepID=A0A433CYX1_9FUNG|nr:armadillo-type protein [Jimgerdemannia flammicorona]